LKGSKIEISAYSTHSVLTGPFALGPPEQEPIHASSLISAEGLNQLQTCGEREKETGRGKINWFVPISVKLVKPPEGDLTTNFK
jgi:hypothetical protein